MHRFLKIMIGLLAVFGGFIIIGVITASIIMFNFQDVHQDIADNSILRLDLNQQISEKQHFSGFFDETIRLQDIIYALDKAAADPRINAVVVELGNSNIGMAKAQEIIAAIKKFKISGKPAIVYAEDLGSMSGGMVDYYIASAADEIWLQPSGGLGFSGFNFEMPYIKDALDKFNITAEFQQRHEYKGGIDIYTQNKMPITVKVNLRNLANSWLKQVVAGVEENKPNLAGRVNGLINNAPYLGHQAVSLGLIDRLGYIDQLDARLNEIAGDDYADISIMDYLSDNSEFNEIDSDDSEGKITDVALIYGVGTIGGDRSGGSDDGDFSPYMIAEALKEAREDDVIKAVIFRVDSPGGAYGQSDMVWREVVLLEEAGKPVVVTMGDYAASGGYFVAMAASHIIANPATITGSIGVYSGKFATKEFWREFGINWDGVKVGKNSGMWSMINKFSFDEMNKFKQSIDFIYDDFTKKAAKGRKMDQKSIDNAARGRVFSGIDALEIGLVDELGGMAEAKDAMRNILNLNENDSLNFIELPKEISSYEQFQQLISGGDDFLLHSYIINKISAYIGVDIDYINALKPKSGILQINKIVIR